MTMQLDPLRENPQHHNGAPSSLIRIPSCSRSGSADKVIDVDEVASAATERTQLLGLPSPTEVLGLEEGVWGGWWRKALVAMRRNLGITQRGRRGKVYLRVVRSVVLVAKVCLYFSLCESCNLHATDTMPGAKYTLHMAPRPCWTNEAKGGSCSAVTGGSCGRYSGGVQPLESRGCDFFGAGFGPCVCCCMGEGSKVVFYCLSVFFSWLGCMD